MNELTEALDRRDTMRHKIRVSPPQRMFIKNTVLEALHNSGVNTLPVDLEAIWSSYNIIVVSYTKAKKYVRVNESIDGCMVYMGSKRLIIFNEKAYPARIRWTIAHEIGHVLLNHHIDDKSYPVKEAEANYFAEQLLMPLAVLDKLGVKTAKAIAKTCDVSMQAAKYRKYDFARRYNNPKAMYSNTYYDIRILKQFNIT